MPPLGKTKFTRRQMVGAMRRVYEKTGYAGATVYEREKLSTEPTAVTVMEEFGSWRQAQFAADLPVTSLAYTGKGQQFTSNDLVRAVHWAVNEAKPEKLTARRYDELRQPGMPCSAAIRRRLRKEIGGWSQIVFYCGGEPGSPPHYPIDG